MDVWRWGRGGEGTRTWRTSRWCRWKTFGKLGLQVSWPHHTFHAVWVCGNYCLFFLTLFLCLVEAWKPALKRKSIYSLLAGWSRSRPVGNRNAYWRTARRSIEGWSDYRNVLDLILLQSCNSLSHIVYVVGFVCLFVCLYSECWFFFFCMSPVICTSGIWLVWKCDVYISIYLK